jgi:transcriptional regulator with XRE-family HTH domain
MTKKLGNLVAKMPPERRAHAQERAQETLAAMALQRLRQARELSRAHLVEALGETQPNIWQLEQQADMYVGSLRKYIEAMGGELDIIARFPEGAVRIRRLQEFGANE